MKLFIPKDYKPKLDVRTTESAIPRIKRLFEEELRQPLNLKRVTAPLFLPAGTGVQDNLNGTERPVEFEVRDGGMRVQVPHSLAKWKRMALARYGYERGSGIWTDMDAIRRDEDLSNIHSVYVDQWDWELVIDATQRTLDFLRNTVTDIYSAIRATEAAIADQYGLNPSLRSSITFITSEELERRFPTLERKERENAIAKECGSVFIIGIGYPLQDGKPHDGRAPDYDDWSTETKLGHGLNGDIVVWNPVLEGAFELSSMGIRVDKESLVRQLEMQGHTDRLELEFHKMLMEDKLPLSIGGGIGQSRLCMLLLQKAHIGEVQASVWPAEMEMQLTKAGIHLL